MGGKEAGSEAEGQELWEWDRGEVGCLVNGMEHEIDSADSKV